MSLERIVSLASEMPPPLRDQVVGYAESVDRAMPMIFAEIRRNPEKERADTVVFWAGIRKLFSVVAATFWTLENSIALLNQNDIGRIRIGGTDFSRGSEAYLKMQNLLTDLEEAAAVDSFREMMNAPPKEALLRTYHSEHR